MNEYEVVAELGPVHGRDGQVYFRASDVAALLRGVAASWNEAAADDGPAWAPPGGEVTLLDAATVRSLAGVLRGQADEIALQSIALTRVEGERKSAPAPQPSSPVGPAEAERAASLLSDPGVREARTRMEQGETEVGLELRGRLQPFQDRYDRAAREGDAAGLAGPCSGKHGRWGRICVLPHGHETSMEEPHWGHTSEGQPIAWVGSAPDDW